MTEYTPPASPSAGSATVIGCRSPARSATATAVSTLATLRSPAPSPDASPDAPDGGCEDGTSLSPSAHGTDCWWLCGSDSSRDEVGLLSAPGSRLHIEEP